MAGQPARSSIAVFGLAVGLLMLATIGVVVAAILVASGQLASAAGPWVSPLSVIKAGAIDPAVALASLAGQNDEDVVEQAIAGRNPDTALSVLLYSISLNDQARLTGLLNSGRLLLQGSEKDRAALIVRTAADVAILSPTTQDYGRAVALEQAGQLMAQLGKRDEALTYYSMAELITLQSGRLDSAYRQLLVEALAADYARLGHAERARSLLSVAQSTLPPDKSPLVFPGLLVPLSPGNDPTWRDLQAATARRIDAANKLISALQAQSVASREAARQTLETALIEEDGLCNDVYTSGIAHSDNLLQRVAYARARVEWLALKWRVARQGFGMALVPQWESQAREIEANLHKAFEDYYLILRDAAISLPGNVDAAQATVDVIQDQIKFGRLGMPPNAHEPELQAALNDAWQQRTKLGGVRLYIAINNDKGRSQVLVASSQ